MIEPGLHVGGKHNERRVVTAADRKVVRFTKAASLRTDECSVAEFEAWLAEGDPVAAERTRGRR